MVRSSLRWNPEYFSTGFSISSSVYCGTFGGLHFVGTLTNRNQNTLPGVLLVAIPETHYVPVPKC